MNGVRVWFMLRWGVGRLIWDRLIGWIVGIRIGSLIEANYFVKVRGRSKLGNLSLLLQKNGRRYKCYQCWAADRAQAIATVSKSLTDIFPKIVLVRDKWIVAEWVEGSSFVETGGGLSENLLVELAKMQSTIHLFNRGKLKNTETEQYEYLDFLFERFIDFGSRFEDKGQLEEVVRAIINIKPSLTVGLTHPDFTKRNLVVTNGGGIFVVDNESMSLGAGYEYDLLNTAYDLFSRSKKGREQYFKIYSKYNSLGTLKTDEDFWSLVWNLRKSGAYYQNLDVNQGRKLFLKIRKQLAK